LVASINETDLIGRAENARAILTYFYNIFHEDLFRLVADDAFRHYLPQLPCSHELGPHKTAIPSILASANRFLQHTAHGDLIAYVTGLTRLQDVVDVLTGQIEGMSADKAWMYLRWMSRPTPDLGVFDAFSPADLQVPLTSYIRDVAYCLGLCADPRTQWWTNEEAAHRARVRFTDFAKTLYPEDPCRVDYPLYLLGRWIRGKRLNRALLARYLAFFEAVYQQTGTVPVTYDIVSRDMSSFESQLRAELRKM